MKKEVMKVDGMMCGHCESRVQDALNKMNGLKTCTASAKDNTVVVEYDETKTGMAEIKETIESIGYEVLA